LFYKYSVPDGTSLIKKGISFHNGQKNISSLLDFFLIEGLSFVPQIFRPYRIFFKFKGHALYYKYQVSNNPLDCLPGRQRPAEDCPVGTKYL